MIKECSVLCAVVTMLFSCSAQVSGAGTQNLNRNERSDRTPAHADALKVDRTGRSAFPGAMGYGSQAVGGRGGRLIRVTTLADRVPGSLRECLVAEGPRVCIFDVGGVFRFEGSPPAIRNPFLTIAGETAPSPGVTLTFSGGAEARSPLLIKETHDIVVRHIRVRNDREGQHSEAEDAFTIEASEFVIVDHVSGSWARDEIINGYGDNDHITISNSIFAFGIPRHDKCALLASDPFDAQHMSFLNNICAHSGDRNPDVNFPPGSCVEIVNNIFFNAQSEFAEIWETYGGTPVSLIGNWFIAGPNTTEHAVGIVRQSAGSLGAAQIYEKDNQFDGSFLPRSERIGSISVQSPPCGITLEPETSTASYEKILAASGAWPRDAVDVEVVRNVRERKGRIVRRHGVIPDDGETFRTTLRDTDQDGMPDAWEVAHGSNPASPDTWDDADGDGWANFENYLSDRSAERRTRTP